MSREERFWVRVSETAADDCWLWTGATNHKGYGITSLHGKTARAHRVAWELSHGSIPDGQIVCHRCDNPPCCNPAHLFLGDNASNMIDMATKGRHNGARLTPADVQAIREELEAGASRMDLAHRYGVAPNHISSIKFGRRWGWVA